MGLTSRTLQITAVLVALGAFAGTVAVWPRLARRSAAAVAARVGVLAATQLTVLTVVALVANAYFGFYGSWSDLLGIGGGPARVVEHGGAAAAHGPLWVTGRRPFYSPYGPGPSRSGLIDEVQVDGRRSGISSPAFVYLPPEYFRPAWAHHRFPMVVVLTGYPGTAVKLITLMRYPDVALTATRARTMPPSVLVMLRPTVDPPRDTECADVRHGPRTEAFFAADLPDAVARSFRVSRDPRAHAVVGDSTGGYCALKLAMRHPRAYRAAVSLSGYYRAAHDPTTGDLFGGSARLRHASDLMWRLRHLPPPPVSVLVTTSREEKDYQATLRFAAAVRPPMRVASITLAVGGHNFRTWTRELPAALRWLGHLLAAAPGAAPPPGAPVAAG